MGMMKSMWISWRSSLAVMITLLQIQGLISIKTTAVTGTEGQTFHFRCEYPIGRENNTKYFSHVDDNDSSNRLIWTDKHNEWMTVGRFSLYDNTSEAFFIVKVDGLKSEDRGTYQCGTDITHPSDHITVIQLNVSKVNIMPAFTVDHTGHKLTLQLFLTAMLCVVAIVFVCLFTFCLLLAMKQRRSSPRQKKQISSDYETMMPAVKMETDLGFSCTDPNCPYALGLVPPPADNVTSNHRQSMVSLGFSDYVDIDVPRRFSQYQHLNLHQQEEHVYHTLHGKCCPKSGHRAY